VYEQPVVGQLVEVLVSIFPRRSVTDAGAWKWRRALVIQVTHNWFESRLVDGFDCGRRIVRIFNMTDHVWRESNVLDRLVWEPLFTPTDRLEPPASQA